MILLFKIGMGNTVANVTNTLTTSNFANDLNINIDEIVYCEYLTHNLLKEKKCTVLCAYEAKYLFHKMDKCKFLYETMYNGKNRLILTMVNGDQIEIAFTDCGKYVGKPCSANKLNKWYYISNNVGEKTNPFIYLLT